ncbi:MAG: SpoIID/LytB domain-containing protein [Chlamydia sp.]
MKKKQYTKSISSAVFATLLLAGTCTPTLFSSQLQASFETLPKNLVHIRNLPKQPICKILLEENQSSFKVELQGSHNVYDPYTGKKIESAFLASAYTMVPTVDGIKWGQEFPGIYQILIVPDSPLNPIMVNGASYSGVLAFYQIGSTLSVVNWVSLEDFTRSLMSQAFPVSESDSKEALATYAILYRSLAYQLLIRGQNDFWDMKASDAGYKGEAANRKDPLFIQALKNSEEIIFDVSKSIPEAKKELLSELLIKGKERLPYGEVQNMAENKKGARQILERYFPNCSITLIECSKSYKK